MEPLLSASIGFVGILIGSLLLWIRSDIKDLRSEIKTQRAEQRADSAEIRSEIENLRAEQRADSAEIRSDIKDHGMRIVRIETLLTPPPQETTTGRTITG